MQDFNLDEIDATAARVTEGIFRTVSGARQVAFAHFDFDTRVADEGPAGFIVKVSVHRRARLQKIGDVELVVRWEPVMSAEYSLRPMYDGMLATLDGHGEIDVADTDGVDRLVALLAAQFAPVLPRPMR
jgi:hypothetical protein